MLVLAGGVLGPGRAEHVARGSRIKRLLGPVLQLRPGDRDRGDLSAGAERVDRPVVVAELLGGGLGRLAQGSSSWFWALGRSGPTFSVPFEIEPALAATL